MPSSPPPSPIRPVSPSSPRLIQALDAIAREYPLERKVLVATARGAGRELLRALARARGGWTGFVVETPRPLALQLATPALARMRLRVVDAFEEEALVDDALDRVLAGDAIPAAARDRYRELAGGQGFRQAVRGSVAALRLAGVRAGRINEAPFRDPGKQALLAGVMDEVEAGLQRARAVDVARVLDLATEALRNGAPLPAGALLYLLPGLSRRGAAGRFLEALTARGARVLDTDPVVGLPVPEGVLWASGPRTARGSFLHAPELAPSPGAPSIPETEGLPLFQESPGGGEPQGPTLFRAAGVQEELREVLRRTLATGRRLDEVEIVTPDPGVYGPALHALAERLRLGVTFAVGLPVERTRPGRAVAAWLRWIADDFPSPEIRRLLENDDLQAPAPHAEINPRRLARHLRRLRVGWGRQRYVALVDAALERLVRRPPEPWRDESAEELQARLDRTRRELEALRALVAFLVERAPAEIPQRLELEPRPVAPAALAEGLAAFLSLVPARAGSVDHTARERLLRVLDRIRATLVRPVPFSAAVATVRDHLEIRVPAPRAEGKAPWLSDGGSVHVSDLEHGGLSGRSLTFLVGMDAGRFPGGDSQDPLLLDAERHMLSAALPTAGQRLDERQFQLAALVARLRGDVVMSYAAWEALEARSVAPSPVLLQAYRLATGQPQAGYRELHRHLGVPASRLPGPGAALDREDVWLSALGAGDHLLEGEATVRDAFPRLDAGLRARRAWNGDVAPGPHHGFLAARPAFDPRNSSETLVSASRLETLGTCALRYFFRYVLRLSPPDDPEYQPDAWLDARSRGSLLHDVFERLLREARADGLGVEDQSFVALGIRIAQAQARAMRAELPPPSDSVFQRELSGLEDDVRCFVDHLRRRPAAWIALERAFGFGDDPPVVLTFGDGTVQLRGAVDRIDEVGADGESLRIVDYKTGRTGKRWAPDTGIWHGGRRLQHLLYTRAVEQLEGRPVEVMEYHFPTRNGEGEVRAFHRAALEGGDALVARLLDMARAGRFLPTDDAGDCKFCDFQSACRVVEGRWSTESPAAEWGAARVKAGDAAYEDLRAVRHHED